MELCFIQLPHIINRLVYIKNMRLYTQPVDRKIEKKQKNESYERNIEITERIIVREEKYMDVVTIWVC